MKETIDMDKFLADVDERWPRKCPECKGCGCINDCTETGPMEMPKVITCPTCGGTGKDIEDNLGCE